MTKSPLNLLRATTGWRRFAWLAAGACYQASGRSVWRFATRGMSMSSPSVDASRGLVVVGSNDGFV